MIIIFFFLFLLLLENLLLPALIGPQPFLIIPTFIFSLIFYDRNTKLRLIQAFIFLVITETFSVSGFGSMIVPFMIVVLFYLWLNRFLEIKSGLQESRSLISLFGGAFFLTLVVLSYSYMFLFIQSSNNIMEAWQLTLILIKTSIYQIFGWALAFVVIFKYARK